MCCNQDKYNFLHRVSTSLKKVNQRQKLVILIKLIIVIIIIIIIILIAMIMGV